MSLASTGLHQTNQDPALRRVFCCHRPGADGRKNDLEEKSESETVEQWSSRGQPTGGCLTLPGGNKRPNKE